MHVTLKDIARLAGVSESTVSRVLHNSRLISEKTRRAVLDAARNLNFQVNQVTLIGLLQPMVTNVIYGEIITAVEDQAFHSGYGLILCNSAFDLQREQEQLNYLLHLRGMQGLILIPIDTEAPHIRALVRQSLPHVLVGTSSAGGTDQLNVDAVLGAYTVTRHLLALGHRHIGLLTGPEHVLACRERLIGYRRALDEYHVPFDKALVARGKIDEEGGVKAIEQLLPLIPAQISAVYAITDTMALGALRRLREVGIRIPEELSLAGCDGIPVTAHTHPALTTLWQPKKELGELAVKLLLRQIEARNTSGDDWKTRYSFQSTLYQPRLIPRESTHERIVIKEDAPGAVSTIY